VSLFKELKRRNVIRVAAAYIVATWLLLQIVDVLVPILTLPEWVGRFVFLILVVGFPIALIFAWAFELTPEGIKKESEIDRSVSITHQTGRKLDFVIIGILSVALAWFAWDKFVVGTDSDDIVESPLQVAGDDDSQVVSPDAAAEKSVAVLPFVAMSSGPDDEYFADGLTEEILNSLSQLPELLVTARTSAFSFKGQEIPVQEIATALGVRHIVEGSVRKSGDRLRVTAQLIRAEDGFHLWSENYDSTSADTIAVQENIAEQIASALDVVLDERKRRAMHEAGLRDVEAFTLFQKGLELYNRAHGDIDQIDGLRQANVYFESVMERVPSFSRVYMLHSDLFTHILQDHASGTAIGGITEAEIANAYPAAIADYSAAIQHAHNAEVRHVMEMDLAFVSGNWQGLTGRIETALAETSCSVSGNWLSTVADVFGYAGQYHERSMQILSCDPRRSISWFFAARSALLAGDKVEALRLAREGSDIAPGSWLAVILLRTLIASDQFDEANREIENQVTNAGLALVFEALMAAHRGEREPFEQALREYEATEDADPFWILILHAWGGHRDEANAMAASVDAHPFGPVTLVQQAHWCSCGHAWDLEATPKLAALIEDGNLPWPAPSVMSFPLKDW